VEPTVEPEVAREPEAASGPEVMLEPEAIAGSGGDEAGDPVEEAAPSTAEEEAQPVLAGAPAARPVGQGASGNIFMLNKVK
jgi:hypothetical protein